MLETFVGIALVIIVAALMLLLISKPITHGILKEISEYKKAEEERAMKTLQGLLGMLTTVFLGIMTGGKNFGVSDFMTGEKPKLTVIEGGKEGDN